jgi:hypothetical protein
MVVTKQRAGREHNADNGKHRVSQITEVDEE